MKDIPKAAGTLSPGKHSLKLAGFAMCLALNAVAGASNELSIRPKNDAPDRTAAGTEAGPATNTTGTEAGPATQSAPGLRIGLSPAGEKRAERLRQIELYRRAFGGEESARQEWNAISAPARTSLLAELAVTRGRDEAENAARRQGLHELATLPAAGDPDGLGLVALARVAVADPSGAIRGLACTGLAARGDERVPALLACALRNPDPLVRANAQAALKAIGGPRVIEVVIEHWKTVWGGSSRNHVFFGQVRSYVGDYDISGDSYDPVVRSFFTGAVLDARVLRVEQDVYIVTLKEISGADPAPANNAAAWEKWLQTERPRLAQEARKKREKALVSLQGYVDE